MLEIVKNIDNVPSYNALRLAIYKRGLKCDIRYCRKLHASHLIKSGIDTTTIDMLQGRGPPSVLARHYQTPSQDLKDRVLEAVDKLKREIER